jgi:hypothetical protein
MTGATLLSQVLDATDRNDRLSGDDLRIAALSVASAAVADDLAVFAVDAAGGRVIGAALYEHSLRLVNTSKSIAGERVLLVAGYVVGTSEIAATARLLRLRGASRVDVALLTRLGGPIPGCDQVVVMQRSADYLHAVS